MGVVRESTIWIGEVVAKENFQCDVIVFLNDRHYFQVKLLCESHEITNSQLFSGGTPLLSTSRQLKYRCQNKIHDHRGATTPEYRIGPWRFEVVERSRLQREQGQNGVRMMMRVDGARERKGRGKNPRDCPAQYRIIAHFHS